MYIDVCVRERESVCVYTHTLISGTIPYTPSLGLLRHTNRRHTYLRHTYLRHT